MVQILPQINTIIYTKKLLGGDYMKDMVKISNLNQTFYTKDGELEVLKNINFNLMEGQILTILGPSGSGKSTILNILTNLFILAIESSFLINLFIVNELNNKGMKIIK